MDYSDPPGPDGNWMLMNVLFPGISGYLNYPYISEIIITFIVKSGNDPIANKVPTPHISCR